MVGGCVSELFSNFLQVAFACNGTLRTIFATGISLGYIPLTETLGHFRESGMEIVMEILLFAAFEHVKHVYAS